MIYEDRDYPNGWNRGDGEFSVDGDILSYCISESGTNTVETDTDKASAIKRFPFCGTDETNIRLSSTQDENPDEIVWFIETAHFIGNIPSTNCLRGAQHFQSSCISTPKHGIISPVHLRALWMICPTFQLID